VAKDGRAEALEFSGGRSDDSTLKQVEKCTAAGDVAFIELVDVDGLSVAAPVILQQRPSQVLPDLG
jgi:hypothetical protein